MNIKQGKKNIDSKQMRNNVQNNKKVSLQSLKSGKGRFKPLNGSYVTVHLLTLTQYAQFIL
jgi:hypothetical protein